MKWSFVPFTEMEKFVYSNVNTSLEDVDNFFFTEKTKFYTTYKVLHKGQHGAEICERKQVGDRNII